MYTLEDHYWWFVGRRRLALDLLKRALSGSRAEGNAKRVAEPARFADQAPPPAEGNGGQLRILDLGCGTGVVLRELGAWSNPIGVDMSPHALDFCRQRGLSDTIQADGIALPLRSNSVDAVIGLDIFEHIEDDVAAFAECFRVIKPGGVLVLSVPAFRSLWGPHDVALMHFRRYRRSEVRQRLTEAGFEVRRAGYSVFFLFPIVCLWRFFEKRKKGPAQASLVGVPPWANRLLIGIQDLETSLIRGVDLPWGSSVVAVGQKPTEAAAHQPQRGERTSRRAKGFPCP